MNRCCMIIFGTFMALKICYFAFVSNTFLYIDIHRASRNSLENRKKNGRGEHTTMYDEYYVNMLKTPGITCLCRKSSVTVRFGLVL